jgi:hypothetical protein
LTQAQRDSWNSAVASYSKTDIFGDLRNPSGANLFQKLNNNLQSIGIAFLTSAPLPVEVPNTSVVSLSVETTGSVMEIFLSGAVATDSALKIFATAPQSPGKSFVKSEYRIVAQLDPTDTSPADIAAAYVAKFGTFPSVGQKIFVKALPISTLTGQAGSASSASAIVIVGV